MRRTTYFQQDLFSMMVTKLGDKKFTAKHAGFTPTQVSKLFEKIKMHYLRREETFEHARNKLLLWLDWLHNSLSYAQISEYYDIGASTAVEYLKEVPTGICSAYKNTGVISFPTKEQRRAITKTLRKKGRALPDAVITVDGSHPRCKGKKSHPERLSWKHNFEPGFNVTFIIERGLGTICAYNLDPSCHKHDKVMFEESEFYRSIKDILGDWVILADKGYVGLEPEHVAATVRKTDYEIDLYSKKFWKELNSARADAEAAFSHFFNNKFPLLSHWTGTAHDTFVHLGNNVTACIIIYNAAKMDYY